VADKGILTINGIKCDNPKCDYENTTIQLQEYKNWINKTCPKCNTLLLTENDYNIFKLLTVTIGIANKVASDVQVDLPINISKVYKPTTKKIK